MVIKIEKGKALNSKESRKLITLYKRDSKGRAQEWSIFVQGNSFWAEYGLCEGKKQADVPTICKGKNIGRANETTPEQQALLEAESKINKQKDKGYSESVGGSGLKFTPMLSHEFGKHGHKLPESVAVSPKLDGLRLFITKDGAFSRNGKLIVSAKYIQEELAQNFQENPNWVIDGEIYNHLFKDDFNKIVSLAKKSVRISDEDWFEISEFLEFHVFDVFDSENPQKSFVERNHLIEKICEEKQRIKKVSQFFIQKYQIDEYHEKFLEGGYEGIMVRDPSSPYQQKRSYFLQKYKNFQDDEFKILDVEEGRGNWTGKAMKLICEKDGKTFEAVPKGNEEYRKNLLLDKEKIRGKFATVKYQNLTPDGVPRFGIALAIRDYE